MTISMTSNNNALVKDKYFGGCLSGAGALATNPVVCFYGKGFDAITETTGGTAPNDHSLVKAGTVIPYYMPVKNWVTTAVVTGAAAITVAKWYTVYSGMDCSATVTQIALASVATITTCRAADLNHADTTALTAAWFQPKEISTKIYPTMPRFSAKESATWIGMTDLGKKGASGCTAKALTGASALVAGAAVAFGAAALAF